MFSTIYVPVDNSDHSNASIALAMQFGKYFGSKLVGSHVYAAKLHDIRFKQMEFTLPDEYKEDTELEKQRKIHDSLITRGLHLISDSYMDGMDEDTAKSGLELQRKHFDGKNFVALVDDINDNDYDLVILGALGQGAVKESVVGSVTERVLRRTHSTTLVVRDPETACPSFKGKVLVTIDGSPDSYGALKVACRLARASRREVEVLAIHNPVYDERELLEAHLELAQQVVMNHHDLGATTTLLEGVPLETLLDYVGETKPWLVSVGRSGIDSPAGSTGLGSTAERLVRHSKANVLVGQAPEPVAEAAVTEAVKKAIAAAL